MFLSAKTVYCVYIWSFLFFCRVHHFIIVHLEIQDLFYKRYMNMSVEIQSFICLWTSGNEVYHEDPSFPGGARQHIETEGRIRECIHTVSLVQTTTKSQNSEPATVRKKPVTGR